MCLVHDGIVDLRTAERIVALLTDDASAKIEPIEIINAYDSPKYSYILDRKAFLPYVVTAWICGAHVLFLVVPQSRPF